LSIAGTALRAAKELELELEPQQQRVKQPNAFSNTESRNRRWPSTKSKKNWSSAVRTYRSARNTMGLGGLTGQFSGENVVFLGKKGKSS
jgi:hypothetical protein